MWRKGLEEDEDRWQKHMPKSFDPRTEKGIVVYDFSVDSELVTTQEDATDIADTIRNDDVSVVFSVCSADQGE